MVDYRKQENWRGQLKHIRLKCLDCCADSIKLVRECHIYTCPLWPFRFGQGPRTAGKKLYDFPDPKVFEIENPHEATDYAGTIPVDDASCTSDPLPEAIHGRKDPDPYQDKGEADSDGKNGVGGGAGGPGPGHVQADNGKRPSRAGERIDNPLGW